MAEGRGIPVICAIGKAATWATPVDVDVAATVSSFRFRPLTWEVTEDVAELPDESFNGFTMRRDRAKTGRYLISGAFSLEVKYEGLDYLFALAMGSTYDFSGAGPYTGKYQPIDVDSGSTTDTDLGVFATIAWYDGADVHEVASAKITRWKFSASAGNIVMAEFDWIGNRRVDGGAVVQTSSTMTNATEDADVVCVQSLNSVVSYQAAAQGGSLANIELINWEVEGTKEHDTGDIAYSSTYSPYPREFRLGRTTVTGSIQLPYENTNKLDDWLAGTLYELKLDHTTGNPDEVWGLWLPSVKYTGGTFHPTSMGQIPHVVNFVCERAVTAPSWTAPIVPSVIITNNTDTDPLA